MESRLDASKDSICKWDDEVRIAVDKCEKLIGDAKSIISEINIYKWALRALFAFVIGGSIVGFIKARDYIDDIIAARIKKQDDLYAAAILVTSGNTRAALASMLRFLNSTGSNKPYDLSSLSREQKEFVFTNLLYILSALQDTDPDGNFIGREQWKYLLLNDEFRMDYLTDTRRENNPGFLYNMAMCYLRYGESKAEIQKADNYLNRAIEVSKDKDRRIYLYHAGLVKILLGDEDKASVRLEEAIEWDIYDYWRFEKLNPKNIISDSDRAVYERMWNRTGNRSGEFSLRLRTFLARVQDERNRRIQENKIQSFDIFSTNDKRNAALEMAMEFVKSVKQAIAHRDFDKLKSIMPLESFMFLQSRLDKIAATTLHNDAPMEVNIRNAYKDAQERVVAELQFAWADRSGSDNFDEIWTLLWSEGMWKFGGLIIERR